MNKTIFFPFPGNITVNFTPLYNQYRSCVTESSFKSRNASRFATTSKCRQQVLGTSSSRIACNLPTAVSWMHKIRQFFYIFSFATNFNNILIYELKIVYTKNILLLCLYEWKLTKTIPLKSKFENRIILKINIFFLSLI